MGEALYRKYRPKSLSEVVGQPHITQTLENALKLGRISHGYLFSGPRGVGKTSIARILAYEINGFTYGDGQSLLDIIEIDAASNRRIDEIREIRNKVHAAPVIGKYKVYIIDEVHMLTREAFNALLKTLEEPPSHVVFILATTEAHKLPETIISRTQRYVFKAIGTTDIVLHLKELAKKEGVKISESALMLIAEHAEGSFRDSISLLDQLCVQKNITDDVVQALLGIPPATIINELIATMQDGNIQRLTDLLRQANDAGFLASLIAKHLNQRLRQALISNERLFGDYTIQLMQKLLMTSSSSEPGDYLELVLIDVCLSNIKNDKRVVTNASTGQNTETKESTVKKAEQKVHTKEHIATLPAAKLQDLLNNGLWEAALTLLKKRYNTLYGVARMVKPIVDNDTLVLCVPFAFHNKRLSEEKNSAIISATLAEVAGGYVTYSTRVEIQNDKTQILKKPTVTQPESDTLQTVTHVFGGAEAME